MSNDMVHQGNYPSRTKAAERSCKHCGNPTHRKPCGKTYCPTCVSRKYFEKKAEDAVCLCGLAKMRYRLKSGRCVWRCPVCWQASYVARSQMARGAVASNVAGNAELADRIAQAHAARRHSCR